MKDWLNMSISENIQQELPLFQKILTKTIEQEADIELDFIYNLFPDIKKSTIRGRVYRELGEVFERVSKGVYRINKGKACALIVNGNSRNLSEISPNSIDMLYADHPWDGQHKGGNRQFNDYSETNFKYSLNDFKEKFRVLKDGRFLIENLPWESEDNWEYLAEIKKAAINAGFKYFACTPWKKGKIISNTGRVAKNKEMIYFFTKGKARFLRENKKLPIGEGNEFIKMSGTSEIIPISFDFQPKSPNKRAHKAEKPTGLFEKLLLLTTKAGEIVLDQFAGSFNMIDACFNVKRLCIAYEVNNKYVRKKLDKISD